MDAEHLEAYLAEELDARGRNQVEHALRNDSELRQRFLDQIQLDSALRALMGDEVDGADELSFEESIMARLRSEGADSYHGFAKSVLTEIVEERDGIIPLRWPDLVKAGIISAAASIALMFALQGIIFSEAEDPGFRKSPAISAPAFVARLENTTNLTWAASSVGQIREDGWLNNGLLEIESGKARIAFNSGATAMVEGPASLSIESNNRVYLQKGRITAEVPPAASGFTVNTPRLNVVDIGTRFGVKVGANGDSELHVMQGMVEASRTSGNAVATLVREGLALRADARTRSELSPVPYAGDEFTMQVGSTSIPVPALRYSFDEGVGAVIEDTGSERLYDIPLVASGELGNSPRRAAGKNGAGLVLQPGTSLEAPLSKDFRLESAFTIGFWVKIPPRLGDEKDQVLMNYGREETGWNVSCHQSGTRGSRGAVRVAYGNGFVVGTTDIADGNWHHVAFRFIGGKDAGIDSHLHLFVDGNLETFSDFSAEQVSSGRAGVLQLGHPGANGLEGWIDEITVFREAIPTTSVHELSKE